MASIYYISKAAQCCAAIYVSGSALGSPTRCPKSRTFLVHVGSHTVPAVAAVLSDTHTWDIIRYKPAVCRSVHKYRI